MFSEVSNFVKGVDTAFAVIIGISLFFLIGITFFMIYFSIRYSRKRHPKPVDVKDNMKLEIAWTIIPTIIVLIMFFYGWLGYTPMRKVPEGAITVKTTGFMWGWKFEYENGKLSNDILVVPQGKAVKLELYSPDVLHSFYVPAFRIKEDVVPGKNNYMWFTANELGEYDVLCAEYCGLRHSYMLGKVKVVTVEEYTGWVNQLETVESTTEPVGLQVIKKNGCIASHSLDGSKLVGPSFKGLYGTIRKVTDSNGKTKSIKADDNYIKNAVYDPNAEIVDGYNKGLMISYKESVSEEELKEIISYLKSLNE